MFCHCKQLQKKHCVQGNTCTLEQPARRLWMCSNMAWRNILTLHRQLPEESRVQALCCKLQCYKAFSEQRVMTSVYAREGGRFYSDDVKRTLNLCCATSRSCSARATACCADSSCPAAPAEAASAWAARWTASSARSWAATTSCAAL